MTKKILANEVIDLYLTSKKLSGEKKKKLLKRIVYMSQHLNEFVDVDKLNKL